MEFPIEIQMLINAYAKPMTRPDWREGSTIMRTLRTRVGGGYRNWNPEYHCHLFRDQLENISRRFR